MKGDETGNVKKACNHCDGTFVHNSELELHMKEAHEAEQKHKCEECANKFFLEWTSVHIRSEQCTFDLCRNKLCQFKHDMHEDGANELDDDDDEQVTKKNQCHLSYKQLNSYKI